MSSKPSPAIAAARACDAPPSFVPAFDLAYTDPQDLRQRLRDYFTQTFDRYESLFETLACDEAWYRAPISLRHPLVFYFGHTATFFVNKLLLARMIDQRIDPELEAVFAVGVDEMSWDDLNEPVHDWPGIQRVRDYRARVRAMVTGLIERAPLDGPLDWDSPWWAIVMGIEHERIHLETSSVLIRQQALQWVKPHPDWRPCSDAGTAPENTFVHVPAGTVALGRPRSGDRYGWDNEYGRHDAEVEAFEAARMLTSNAEFREFVDAGGYANRDHWEDEGQRWLAFSKARHPTFWVPAGDDWRLRLMTEEVPMPWNWPVEVNFHEAKAYCNWKARTSGRAVRMPTEDEWQRIFEASRAEVPEGAEPDANLNLAYCASSCAVDRFAQGGFFDVTGNAWQWTETPIYPFEGFEVHPIYDDFSTPTFDTRHNLMKGGSWIATGNEADPGSRYAFRRHFFQHAGFRCIVSNKAKPVPTSHYETDSLLSEYAEFHYGAEYYGVPNFPRALVELALAHLGDTPRHSALDLGCASGRATFELARHFERVTGVDFSARFIGQGAQLARGDALRFLVTDEGELQTRKAVGLAELGLADVAGKVEFWQGDACNLKPTFTGYDFILAANLIDRLYDPARFLEAIHERLNLGGVLMIASPYTWLAEHTPREAWLGGFLRDGKETRTLDGLHAHLDKHFDMVGAPIEVPFVIRETRHKFQHTLSEATFWKRVR